MSKNLLKIKYPNEYPGPTADKSSDVAMVREVQRRTITNGNRMLLFGKQSATVAPKGSVDSSVRTYFHMNFFGYKV